VIVYQLERKGKEIFIVFQGGFMKKYLKNFAVIATTLTLGISSVNAATSVATIDKNACDTVYTNYYFFLEAETDNLMGKTNLSTFTQTDLATYKNNFYSTTFDSNNVGYGQVSINRSTTTSNDKISSMSLKDYYSNYLKAIATDSGVYTSGTSNFIVSHGDRKYSDGVWSNEEDALNFNGYSVESMMNATMDASSEMTRLTSISYDNVGSFGIKIVRTNYKNLTGTPVTNGRYSWYLQPAIYYVQYCSKKTVAPVETTYTIVYKTNTTDTVVNMPSDVVKSAKEDATISSKVPVRSGYTFLGWSTKSGATTPESKYDGGNAYTDRKNLVLYAVWSKNDTPTTDTYSVVYRPNTTDVVTNLPASETKTVDETAIISTLTPVREGHTFIGWSTQEGATVADDNYKAGTEYVDKKDLVLYAVWKKNETNNENENLPTNPKTGISSYIAPFSGVTLASGLALGLLKKKKSFLQF